MQMTVKDGFLGTAYRTGEFTRTGKVVDAAPDGTVHDRRIITDGGAAYRTGWFTLPGTRQSVRVAWLDRT